MTITLRYFAALREAVATSQETLALPQEGTTVGALRTLLIGRGGAWEQALAPQRAVRMALNQRMCGLDEVVTDGDEVAFFPPVTGG